MNLRGSHLLYLVIIIFINYILYKNNVWIGFSLYYWIIIMIEEINNFFNKYFTFKF